MRARLFRTSLLPLTVALATPAIAMQYEFTGMCVCCAGIEKFWWSSKNHFNKRLLAAPAEIDRVRFEQLVLDSVNNVTNEKVRRLCSSNRAFVSKTLREAV